MREITLFFYVCLHKTQSDMEILRDILLIVLSASAAIVAGYFAILSTQKQFLKYLEQQHKTKLLELRKQTLDKTLPLKLQAYERLILFLERIAFENLIPRTPSRDFNVFEYQQLLIQTIRQEFEHNLSQQLFVSDAVWQLVKNAKEETISTINAAASRIEHHRPANELSAIIFEIALTQKVTVREQAIAMLKNEVRELI